MAGPTDELKPLLTILRSMREEDYVALASRGLLRRARKDIAHVKFCKIHQAQAELSVTDCTVLLPATGPAQATCNCPTPGICQHVLAACLHLAETADETTTSKPAAIPVPTAWWLQLDSDQLRKWAGAENWRYGARLVSEVLPEEIIGVVRFRDGTEVRLIPAMSLEGIICKAPTRYRKRYITAAVLARRGESRFVETCLAESRSNVPRELLGDVMAQVVICLRTGLSRLPRAIYPSLSVLATQCRASGMYRPGKELEACAQEILAIQKRMAQADTETLLLRLLRLFALIESLNASSCSPSPSLVGSARSVYQESDALKLVGLGAYPWETPSGFHGVTMLFWEPDSGRGLSWTDSRPKTSGDGFSPHHRYDGEGPWANGGSLETASASRFKLLSPRLNHLRRLSSSSNSRVESTKPVSISDLPPAYESWAKCRADQRNRPSLGLHQAVPIDKLVHLRPIKTMAPRWDEVTQSQLWRLIDGEGAHIDIVLPFIPLHAQASKWIEEYWNTSTISIIGLYQGSPTESVHPVSVIRPNSKNLICSLGFADGIETKTAWLKRIIGRSSFRSWQSTSPVLEDRDLGESLTPLHQILSPLHTELLHAAERGLRNTNQPSDWENQTQELAEIGLVALSTALKGAFQNPENFLKAGYTLNLYMESEAE